MNNILNLEMKLLYVKSFTPHKVGYYIELIRQEKLNIASSVPTQEN
jgi:hypothetical protein